MTRFEMVTKLQVKKDVIVTVIIPVYNGELFIGEAIDSFLMQKTNFEKELIVVDDGSSDRTAEIINSYQLQTPEIRLIKLDSNRGKGFAVSVGYEHSLGRYIQILDADDFFLLNNKLQVQVNFLESHPNCFATAHNTLVYQKSLEPHLMIDELSERKYAYEDIVEFNFYVHTSSVLVRKIPTGLISHFKTKDSFRGDSAFLYYHAFYFKSFLHYFPMIASGYRVHEHGIWSSLTDEERKIRTRALFEDLRDFVVCDESLIEFGFLTRKLRDML
jgi:glycosyltransferase involved in cell wall biosynthesis